MNIPVGATHYSDFYSQINFFKKSETTRYNSVIDHPEECWQKFDLWQIFEKDKWTSPGSGWSNRSCKPIETFNPAS